MKKYIYIFLFSLFGFGQIHGQNPTGFQQDVNVDDLGNVTDEFQEYFFEALKQKGIENYEKAVTALKKCAELNPNMPVIYFELGKNYKLLKNYDAAIENLKIAHEAEAENKDIIAELYDSYFLKRDFENAIVAVQKLIEHDSRFSEDLANLYFLTGQYDEALAVLDELDKQLGNSEYRDTLRKRIYAHNDNQDAQISILKKRISEDPNDEKNYLNLIFVYSENGEEKKAFETAKDLIAQNPDSELAHLALYKFYLSNNSTSEAVKSMEIVLGSQIIDPESKFKVLNDFLLFVNENEEYKAQFEQIVQLFAEQQESATVYEKLGEYFVAKKDVKRALQYFEQGLELEPDNFGMLKQSILLNIDIGNFSKAKKQSEYALDFFPSQPLLYLLNAVAHNGLGEYTSAEEMLLLGMDYLIDDPKMTSDFHKQLSIAYKGMGNLKKSEEYERKIQATLNKNQ